MYTSFRRVENQFEADIFLLFSLSSLVWTVNSYSNGAGSNACNTLRPGNSHGNPSTDASPYNVEVLNGTMNYTPGTKVSGKLHPLSTLRFL